MRDIKFRIFSHFNGLMIEHEHLIDDEWTLDELTEDDFNLSEPMQFTGLTDKNGTEIYEGDILKANIRSVEQNVLVRWNDFFAQWRLYEGEGYTRNLDFTSIDDVEVLGNIYQNPELLKEEK